MNELYEMIEKKIKESGYPRPISGSVDSWMRSASDWPDN